MKQVARVLMFILVLLIATGIYNAANTYAEKNEEYTKELEKQITLLKGRIALLEGRNAVLEKQITVNDEQIVLLKDYSQMQDSEIDKLWTFIRRTVDYQDLTRIVEAEAGGESYEGKLHVAAVVINRVDHRFATTVHDVIYQPGQFDPVRNGRFAKVKVSEESIKASEYIIRNGSVTDALFFMNPELAGEKSRAWMRSLNYVATVGNHEFYR